MEVGTLSDSYGKDYSAYYDVLYSDKDYTAEVEFVTSLFNIYSTDPIRSVLELGCGSGGHAIPLARKGFSLTAVDLSSPMLEAGKKKAGEAGLDIDFKTMDIRRLSLNKTFDACISMFAVLGYITNTDELVSAFRYIRKHLKQNALFVMDFWNGLAVMRMLPEVRSKEIEGKGYRILRIAEPQLDAFNHICHINYRILVFRENKLIDDFQELHTVRFFFPQEMAHYLKDTGFRVMKICPFMDHDGQVNEKTWNITIVATT